LSPLGKTKAMLKLIDLIQLAGVTLTKYKIHLATSKNTNLLSAFHAGTFKEWQEHQNQENFACAEVISLIELGKGRWLFAGAWRVLGVGPTHEERGFKYNTEEILGLKHLVGRVVVRFERTFRNSYLRGDNYGDRLEVLEVRALRESVEAFPGYSGVNISYQVLDLLRRDQPESWVTALSSVAGVYLITDGSNGRLYVGSAYGQGGIWRRWMEYAEQGHGGNVDLQALLREKGASHTRNFQFAILEIRDRNSTMEEVVVREAHWKDVLRTRQFGYNRN
jgi:hypothetical protein